jgi:flagellar biogenesis protein FliO
MNKHRNKLADKVRKGYNRKTIFFVYLFMFLIIGGILLAAYLYS